MGLIHHILCALLGHQDDLERIKQEVDRSVAENRRSSDALRAMTEQMRRTENQDRDDDYGLRSG